MSSQPLFYGHMKPFITTIADIDIAWESDCPSEMEKIKDLFHYHHTGSHDETHPLHHIIYMPAWKHLEPDNTLEVQWEGYYVGCFHKENHVKWLFSPSTGEDILLLSEEIWIVHNREKATTTCFLYCRNSTQGYVERPDISDTIILLIHTVMAMYHRYTIHAAAVEIEGKGHIFVGESGHGKSTLCTDLVSKGAGYLGDDIVFLYTEEGLPYMGSLLFKAKLFPDGIKNHKDFIDVIEKYRTKIIFKAPIKNIYYICRSPHKESQLKKMEPMDMLVRLIRASNNIRMQYDREVWQEVCQLTASKIPYYSFLYGKRELVNLKMFKDA